MKLPVVLLSLLFAVSTARSDVLEVLRELNLARTQPAQYAVLIATGAGGIGDRDAVREAVAFMEKARALPPLAWSEGLTQAALLHVADQGSRGNLGHRGNGGPDGRVSQFGQWQGCLGENIQYGRMTPREIVISLIVDAGVRGRPHRKNIFQPAFRIVGVAQGPHQRFGSMCVMDFAGGFSADGKAARKRQIAQMVRRSQQLDL